MKLHTGMSPNGARVTIFLAEKGIELPIVPVDVIGGETRLDQFFAINSLGEVPVLELDDGRYLSESIAICRYLEALHPEPPLFGTSAQEQAFVEMWNRRIELRVFEPIGQVGLHEIPFFADKVEQIADYAASQRRLSESRLEWLDNEMSDGRPFVAGDDFTVADITMIAALMVCGFVSIEIPARLEHLNGWINRVKERSSFPEQPG